MTCNCKTANETNESMLSRVDAIIDEVGTSRRMIIPLLQAIQNEFSFLTSEALERIYERTEIDRAQLVSVSTFYSQFRHIPYGKHLIKVCTGTACHVKGAGNVYDAFRRELKMTEDNITSDDKLFSIEKIACLGCCTLAPVVQIDEKIYGHVLPGKVNEVIVDFLEHQQQEAKKESERELRKVAGEIRLGMGSCCQASGSSDIYSELLAASRSLGVEINIKAVGCVGVCNKVPLIDVVMPNGSITRYPNVKAAEIKEILHLHFQPAGYLKRMTNSFINHVDNLHTDTTWDNVIWKSAVERTGIIDSFLSGQKHISTEGYGFLAPLNIDEYIAHNGFEGLRKALKTDTMTVVDTVFASGLRGRGGGGFPTGKKWKITASTASSEKYIICNGDEGDPGAFMDRMMLESYPFRVIEGMIIAGY
ncbi:MAG: NAD(P)H-dependent oxidoreductase subunit E, partial [Bacteroidales bacterium]|nr:NAD(P)H-dependent oxidoreductase subunit E [Bacteroidales bacterium]